VNVYGSEFSRPSRRKKGKSREKGPLKAVKEARGLEWRESTQADLRIMIRRENR